MVSEAVCPLDLSHVNSSVPLAMRHQSSTARAGHSRALTSNAAVLQLRDKVLPPPTF